MKRPPDLMNLFWTHAGIFPGDVEISRFDFRSRVEASAKAGFTGIGLFLTDLDHVRQTLSFADMRSIMDDNGIIHLELEFLTDWFLEGGRKRESDHRRRRLLEASEALGAKHVKVGDFYGEKRPMPQLAEAFAALCAEAAKHGATIAFELMKGSMVNTLPEAIELVETAGAPNGGLAIDIVHQVNLGISFDELRTIPVERVVSVELNDGILPGNPGHEYGIRTFCGEGEFDIKGFIRCLEGMGFAGPWAVEVINPDYAKLPLDEQCARAFATSRAMFA
jgi:sugar phosphate isomerase/epimerase